MEQTYTVELVNIYDFRCTCTLTGVGYDSDEQAIEIGAPQQLRNPEMWEPTRITRESDDVVVFE